jgi:drug/metabolite transporter (DMT)-like permease
VSFTGTSLIAMTAQQVLPASVVGLLNNLSPLWIAIYVTLVGRAARGPLLIAGSVLAAAGVALVLLGSGGSAGRGEGAGDQGVGLMATPQAAGGVLLALSGSMLIAYSQVLTRRLVQGRDPLALTAIGAGWGALPLLALVLVGIGGAPGDYVAASAETRWRLLWLGVMSTAMNFGLWSYALAHLPVSRVTPLQYLIAPCGVALAVALLGEPVGAPMVLGTVAILAGIALARRGAEAG